MLITQHHAISGLDLLKAQRTGQLCREIRGGGVRLRWRLDGFRARQYLTNEWAVGIIGLTGDKFVNGHG
ncbi:hypothetical protein CXG53_05965 [Pseudomonas guariconensis]|uniref:Uncharacterized protein n=1 Tax=Pseudomonas guariconensis TaxID=1288410 RepID=A0ABX4UP80_9PSED|nr:hypothetical protein CXG53_05965 [Pseudomonas guariconensis]PLV30029.1 hypothetical protein CXG51_07975 [Pseudomonas guariconensis]